MKRWRGSYLASCSAFSRTACAIVSASWYFFLLLVSSFTESCSSAWTAVSWSIHWWRHTKKTKEWVFLVLSYRGKMEMIKLYYIIKLYQHPKYVKITTFPFPFYYLYPRYDRGLVQRRPDYFNGTETETTQTKSLPVDNRSWTVSRIMFMVSQSPQL